MQIDLPEGATAILHILEQQGAQGYVVGGCVRDSLLGKLPVDWDICTSALPQTVIDGCVADGLRVVATGLQHGTVTVLWQGQPYEVTTYRVDGAYADGRHPVQVRFVDSLRADLSRRDFTINAMAYHPRTGLVDLFGGQQDAAAGVIRCVGEPAARFGEDALRILRAIRFAATLGFALEPSAAAAVHRQCALLQSIAAERIQTELVRLLCGDNAAAVVADYPDVLGVFVPELLPVAASPADWQRTAQTVAATPSEPLLRLAALLGCCTEVTQAGAILRRLRFDNDTTTRVCRLVEHRTADLQPAPQLVKQWLNRLGVAGLRELVALQRAAAMVQGAAAAPYLQQLDGVERCIDAVVQQRQCYRLQDMAVTGSDLLAAGIAPGATVGQTLRWLLQQVIADRLPNERDALVAAAVDSNRQNKSANKCLQPRTDVLY